MIIHKNTQSSVVTFSPSQTVAFIDCRLKGCSLPWYSIVDTPLMQNQTFVPQGILYDTLSLEPLQQGDEKESKILSYIATRTYTFVSDTNKAMKDHKYPCLDADDIQ